MNSPNRSNLIRYEDDKYVYEVADFAAENFARATTPMQMIQASHRVTDKHSGTVVKDRWAAAKVRVR